MTLDNVSQQALGLLDAAWQYVQHVVLIVGATPTLEHPANELPTKDRTGLFVPPWCAARQLPRL
jgi:hypothetical protein